MDNYVGKRLDGRYEVQEIIGVGGMSVVYKAYDKVDDRIVAVKILKDEFLNNDDFKRRFKNESKAIALLSHDNIVRVYDVNFGEKLQYIVMEYIDGITLKEYINKQGSITWNDALYFMTQILEAVQHAHDKGIVHRDIKPQNIILLPNGNLKVTDFGIARFSRSETKTLTEQAIGSVHYIAPEQAKGEFTDEKADIYSIGVVLYEMLAGKVPFEADSAVSVALMQVQANAEELTQINPDIPKGLEQICVHAMQKNPDDRYQSATEMLFDIEEIVKNPNTTFNYTNNIEPIKKTIKEEPVHIDEEDVDEYQEVEEVVDKKRRRKVIGAVIIGTIVMIATVGLVIYAFTSGFNTKSQTLENFVGFSYDELKDNSSYSYDFITDYEKTDEYDAGTVIKQEPEAGAKVFADAKIKLYIAARNEDIQVPNIYGLELDFAKQTLANNGLQITKVVEIANDNVEAGKVIGTKPKVNTVVSSTQEIIIYVSSGESTTVIDSKTMPDVIGLNRKGARAFLEKTGFTEIEFKTEDSEMQKDVVISQTPAAGSNIPVNEKITIVISSGVTTTTQANVNCSVVIRLPKVYNSNGEIVTDTLVVKLDNETYSSQKIKLDGRKLPLSVTAKANTAQKVNVSLKSTGVSDTVVTDGISDKTYTINFSSASQGNSTTNTTKRESTTAISTTDISESDIDSEE